MAVFPIAGPSYVYSSRKFDAQRCVNLYPVTSETGTSKAPESALMGTPGLAQFCRPSTSPNRGSFTVLGRVFFVFGNTLYEILEDCTSTVRGTLNTTSGFVSIDTNPNQLCIVDGTYGYIFTYATNVFAQITDPYFLGADTVTFLDGYFVFNKPNTNIYYISAINDGLTGDPLDFATAEGSPAPIVAIATVHQQLWIFKEDSVQMMYNSGAADFPFANIGNTTIQYGCLAKGSVVTSANTVFWLGRDAQGKGVAWMAEGYQPQAISTFPVATAIQSYANPEDAVAYTYQEDMHFFYVLTFTSANTTWVYDIGQKAWHERAYFNPTSNTYERHRAQSHVFAFGKHLVGDYENGKIYEQALTIYDDDGTPKRWMRTLPHMAAPNLEYIYYDRLQVDMEVGTGLESGSIQDTNPEVMLQWSNDGGYTWGSELWRPAGKVGEYSKRVIWNRLGRSRDRVFRLMGTSNTKTFLIGAYLDAASGTN